MQRHPGLPEAEVIRPDSQASDDLTLLDDDLDAPAVDRQGVLRLQRPDAAVQRAHAMNTADGLGHADDPLPSF